EHQAGPVGDGREEVSHQVAIGGELVALVHERAVPDDGIRRERPVRGAIRTDVGAALGELVGPVILAGGERARLAALGCARRGGRAEGGVGAAWPLRVGRSCWWE